MSDECPHGDWYRWPNGTHECLDCGERTKPEPHPDTYEEARR